MIIKKLSNQDQPIIRTFLEQDPMSNLYLLDLIDRQGIDYWGMHRWSGVFVENGDLVALNADIACAQPNQPCKLSVPVGDPAGCQLLGERTAKLGGCERLMAESEPADAFYQGLGTPKTRMNYREQLLFSNSTTDASSLLVTAATTKWEAILIEYTALMRVEDEGYDPRERDLDLWTRTIQVLIAQKRILIHESNDEIVFVIEVGTRAKIGAQIGSTYVPPKFRNQGIGTKGMRGVINHLLKESQCITMLVNEKNKPAMRCYEKSGWKYHKDFLVIEMDVF